MSVKTLRADGSTSDTSGADSGITTSQEAPFADIITAAQGALDNTLLNTIWSGVGSSLQAFLLNETPTKLSFLTDQTVIRAPDTQYQATHSPTVSQLFNAANAAYVLTPASPVGMSPFLVGGKQLAIVDQVSGVSARVWETSGHQVIIAYSGTSGGDTLLVNPTQFIGESLGGMPSVAGQVSQAQTDALAFARYVSDLAGKRGITSNDIFVTGHSIGAVQAEYVAQQTGLGGIAFDGAGIPRSATAVGDGSNFISMGTYGDAWSSYSSDIEGDQPASPAYVPGGGALPHWGTNIMVGDVADQLAMHKAFETFGSNIVSFFGIFLTRAPVFHNPGAVAADLGIDPYPYSILGDSGASLHGTAFAVGNDTISQTIAANLTRTDYHATALPTS